MRRPGSGRSHRQRLRGNPKAARAVEPLRVLAAAQSSGGGKGGQGGAGAAKLDKLRALCPRTVARSSSGSSASPKPPSAPSRATSHCGGRWRACFRRHPGRGLAKLHPDLRFLNRALGLAAGAGVRTFATQEFCPSACVDEPELRLRLRMLRMLVELNAEKTAVPWPRRCRTRSTPSAATPRTAASTRAPNGLAPSSARPNVPGLPSRCLYEELNPQPDDSDRFTLDRPPTSTVHVLEKFVPEEGRAARRLELLLQLAPGRGRRAGGRSERCSPRRRRAARNGPYPPWAPKAADTAEVAELPRGPWPLQRWAAGQRVRGRGHGRGRWLLRRGRRLGPP